MEEAHDLHNFLLNELKMHKEDSKTNSVEKENKILCSVTGTTDKNKLLKNNKSAANEKAAKSSKIASLLDSYCNNLNESLDFVECELTNKFRTATQKSKEKIFENGSQVNEVIVCEICKEDITSLDVHNRSIHVNKCIDEQTSSDAAIPTQFSTNEDVFILECPLCFKNFPSPETRSSHIKKCGRSKGLSLQSILKALELQERHALERISLGLPAKPIKPTKVPKNSVNKKVLVQPKSKAQSDIQLAKALSLSLTNSSQQNDVEMNENFTSVILKPPTANQRPGKKTKKILSSTPLLVLRSDEERKKLLLEKVESILTSAIDSEQNTSVPMDTNVIADKEELTLWHLSKKSFEKHNYYLEELLDYINPSDVEMGAKLFHLSQIPGHEIVTQLPCEYTFSTPEGNNDTDAHNPEMSSITDQHSSSLVKSLSSLVASSWMSDVDIHTACGTVIPAHKLLLAARCPSLKKDSDFCSGTNRVTLKWETVSFDAALQFLNFIYTENIDIRRDFISDLFYLANKYEVFDLQTLLHNYNMDIVESKIEKSEGATSTERKPSSPCMMDITQNAVCETQESMNVDLEIVYNCINSSFKPSQLTNSQSSALNDTASFKCIEMPKPRGDNNGLCMIDDNGCLSDSNCSEKNVLCNNLSQNNCSTSPIIFDVHDSENETNNPLEKPFICNDASSESNCSTSSEIIHVNRCENKTDNLSVEKIVACDNFSSKNSIPTSPVIFDVNDSENDENMSEDEKNECMLNCSQNSVPEPLNIASDESNSSNDSVKFLQSSYISHNVSYKTPEKFRKSALHSPDYSETVNFLPALRNSFQNRPEEESFHSEKSESLRNTFAESKSPIVLFSHVPYEKPHDSVLDKCNEHTDTCVKLKSPIASYSQKFFSDSHSPCKHKSLDATEVEDVLKPSIELSPVNKSLTNELSKIISPVQNKNITVPNSISRENDNEGTFKFSFEKSLYRNDKFSVKKTDENTLNTSDGNSASPEVLICEPDSDSKSQESEKLHDYNMNFSPQNNKFGNNNSNNLPSLFSKNSPVLSDVVDDAVFESFQYFDNEVSPRNENQLQSLNSFKNAEEKINSPNKIDMQSPKCSKVAEKEHALPVTNCFDSPKIPVYKNEKQVKKTATPSTNSEMQQPQFKFSDSPITPLPDYKSMMTPEIRQALKKIGVKPLPRKKAVAILSHVYNETHPLTDSEGNTVCNSEAPEIQPATVDKIEKSKKRKQTSKNSEKPVKKQQTESNTKVATSASPESDESESENPEWLGCVPEISFSQNNHDSPTKPNKDDIESIKLYIQSNEELYHNVLNYTPLNLVEFHQDLKKNDIKISIQKLMDFLDEQCITFTCPRKEEYRKKQTARANRFRKNMIAKMSQQAS